MGTRVRSVSFGRARFATELEPAPRAIEGALVPGAEALRVVAPDRTCRYRSYNQEQG